MQIQLIKAGVLMERNRNLGYSKLNEECSVQIKQMHINKQPMEFHLVEMKQQFFIRRRQDNKYLMNKKKQKYEVKESKSRKLQNTEPKNSGSKTKEINRVEQFIQ
ncbi:unnamed protein product (macronuclear) [Paramecium tetraurelia]|uniref:Uncharacterized protein n=1 Tax=Paramecium tetraurelia TaxID=5888 RepID=A0EH59_PARTE|nr:uncharacterized protein GSPATT00026974001 [Paramecium tetraurelia]CAK94650.1 unnamed protein product [Paramecium tetraurelia]|eukprot:XP_001462023.1 hypothetical protein (macronuclear) [Paramecium tetraurelia strain d4-2]